VTRRQLNLTSTKRQVPLPSFILFSISSLQAHYIISIILFVCSVSISCLCEFPIRCFGYRLATKLVHNPHLGCWLSLAIQSVDGTVPWLLSERPSFEHFFFLFSSFATVTPLFFFFFSTSWLTRRQVKLPSCLQDVTCSCRPVCCQFSLKF